MTRNADYAVKNVMKDGCEITGLKHWESDR